MRSLDRGFWKIVESNDLQHDVVAPAVAAEDPILRSTVSFIENSDVFKDDDMAVREIYMDLGKHLVHKYNMSLELSELAIQLCEDMYLRGDFEHGEA